MIPLPHRQRSEGWLAARRHLITATDIPILLGISPYACEADLADQKRGYADIEENLPMRVGSFLEPLVAAEYTRVTGKRVRRFHVMVRHDDVWWAAASPDGQVVGERRLLEFKTSGSRSRFADGLPEDVQAQVVWQLGVTGYPVADVVVLVGNSELLIIEVTADPALFADLLRIAEDFRRRLGEGGPFARSEERIRRDHPVDDGTAIQADNDTAEAVRALLALRASIARYEDDEKRLKAAIEARMGDAALMTGPGFRVTWKRTKDREETDWRALAIEVTAPLPEPERIALVGRHTTVRAGFRPLRVMEDKE